MKQKPVDSTTKLIDLDSYGDWITPSSKEATDKSALMPIPSDLSEQKDLINDGREIPAARTLVLEQLGRLEKELQSITNTLNSLSEHKLTGIESLLHKLSDRLQIVMNVLVGKPDQSSKRPVSEVTEKDKSSMSTSTDTLVLEGADTREKFRLEPKTIETTELQNKNGLNVSDESLIANKSTVLNEDNSLNTCYKDLKTTPMTDVIETNKEDIRTILSHLDQLLEALPPTKIREFSQSKYFSIYKKIFKAFDLNK